MGPLKFLNFTRIIAFLLISLLSSCGQRMDVRRSLENGETNENIYGSENSKQVLGEGGGDSGEKNSLIIFAGEFCQSCHEEADVFVSSLKHPAKEPNGVKITTVIVEGSQEAADDFKDLHEIPWRVTFEEDHDLQEDLCGSLKTPCLVVADGEGKILLRHVGKIKLEKLKSFTGPWEIED